MASTPSSNDTARRIGIWVVTILVLVGVIYALVRLTGSSTPSAPPSTITAVSSTDHTKGTGKAILIEYADFQCPACKAYEPILRQLTSEISDQVTLVYRYFPLVTIHQNAEAAAWAAEAAGKQGKFWEMHDKLYDGQDSWADERNPQVVFQQYAKDLGLNVEQFTQDSSSGPVRSRVSSDIDSGNSAGINATPTFYLNGQPFSAPTNYADFKSAILKAIGK